MRCVIAVKSDKCASSRGGTEGPAHFDLHSLPSVGCSWSSKWAYRGRPSPVRRNGQPEAENVDQNEEDPLFLLQYEPSSELIVETSEPIIGSHAPGGGGTEQEQKYWRVGFERRRNRGAEGYVWEEDEGGGPRAGAEVLVGRVWEKSQMCHKSLTSCFLLSSFISMFFFFLFLFYSLFLFYFFKGRWE